MTTTKKPAVNHKTTI